MDFTEVTCTSRISRIPLPSGCGFIVARNSFGGHPQRRRRTSQLVAARAVEHGCVIQVGAVADEVPIGWARRCGAIRTYS